LGFRRDIDARGFRALAAAAAIAAASMPLSGQQTASLRGPLPGFGGTFASATGATGAIGGPSLGLAFARPNGVGMEVGLAYLPPSRVAAVFPAYQAVLGDVGAAYALPFTSNLLLIRAGGSFLLNADGQGDLGPYAGIAIVHPLAGRLALRAGVSSRYWIEGPGVGAGADLGITWLPRPRPRPAERPKHPREPHAIDGWNVGAAGTLYGAAFGGDDLTFWGPSFVVSRVVERGVGFESGVTYLVPTGFYGFTGLGLDLGLAYGIPLASRTVLLVRGGASAVGGGDSDGSQGAAVGLYPGVGLVRRLTGRLGARLDVTPRFWLGGSPTVTIGASAALVLLP
jgi:hypothetical protein